MQPGLNTLYGLRVTLFLVYCKYEHFISCIYWLQKIGQFVLLRRPVPVLLAAALVFCDAFLLAGQPGQGKCALGTLSLDLLYL
jgi:hypothetical protein